VDKVAEAKVALFYSTQSPTSFVPVLGGQAKTDVFLLNMRNQIHFTVADHKAGELIAAHIGKRTIRKKTVSYGRQGASRSYTDHDEFWIKPQVLRAMKRFQCVICHCEKGFQKTRLLPTRFTTPTESVQQRS